MKKTLSLKERYIKEVIPALRKDFGYTNVMRVPKLEKVVVNIGVGRIREEKQHQEIQRFLSLIVGQKVSARPAKKAIASFKTRQGLIIGYSVTLRGPRMYDFLTRFIHVALPRTRDFRGVSLHSFDKKGNLTIGVKEHIVFPEMIGEDYTFLFGMQVTIQTNARTKDEGIALFRHLGFPLEKKEQ